MLKGYKTYITAGLSVLGALAGYLTGDLAVGEAIQLAITAVLAVTIRAGVTTENAKK